MKRILAFFLMIVIVGVSACSSRSYPTSDPYPRHPNGNRDVIVTRDGRVIDRYGRVIGTTRNIPPGHAKKYHGSRSARAFAPGQRKKVYYKNDRRNDKHHHKNDRKGNNKRPGRN